jgi:hypothetical protein
MPEPYRGKFVKLMSKYHETHNVFETLKWMQNSFEKNYETVKFRLEN